MSNHERQPRLESTYFGAPGSKYTRMARVLDHTARRHCPDWEVNVRRIEPEPIQGVQREAKFIANTQKLDFWCDTVIRAPLGDRICLIDSDTFLVNGIDDVWDREFDLAYTVRDYIIPFNGGVVFVRVTPGTRAFMERWREVNAAMYHDVTYHMKWKEKYGGLNQASFGCLLESGHGLNLLTLPCAEWNLEDSCWGDFDLAATRIGHVKSGLRRLIFDGDVGAPQYPWWTNGDLAPLAARWHALEREAIAAENAAARAEMDETLAALMGAAQPEEVFA